MRFSLAFNYYYNPYRTHSIRRLNSLVKGILWLNASEYYSRKTCTTSRRVSNVSVLTLNEVEKHLEENSK